MQKLNGNPKRKLSWSTNERKPILKIFLLLAVLALVGSTLGYFYVKSRSSVVKIDPETLCPINRPPSEVVVILLDMSDSFTEPQTLQIQNELQRLIARVNRFGLIELYRVDELSQRVTRPVTHICNPGTGEDMNLIYENPDLARKKWTDFMTRLRHELDQLMSSPESATSTIFEAIQSVALRTFNQPVYDGVQKRLIIVSDLMQNVPGKFSHYDGIVPFAEFRLLPYYMDIRADLTDVSVNVLYLVRSQAPQRWPDHYRFWEEYFQEQGATIEAVKPIHGSQ